MRAGDACINATRIASAVSRPEVAFDRRDTALIRLLLDSGARRSEVAALTLETVLPGARATGA